jgi:hypothetical protein
MVGLCNALCIWDHFHLLKKVWPEKFGPHVFAKLENGLRGMLGAESPAAFEEAFQHVRRHLLSDPVNLDYIKTGFYHHPEKFATFKINEVEGSMERKGDTPAEQNHSSIVSHLGNGSCQPIENQIMKLFTRQKELLAKRNTATARYNLVCDNLAAEESDPSEEEAILVLSNYAYNQIWETEKQESMYYTRQVLEDGSTRVHRKGAPAASARVIAPGERCNDGSSGVHFQQSIGNAHWLLLRHRFCLSSTKLSILISMMQSKQCRITMMMRHHQHY